MIITAHSGCDGTPDNSVQYLEHAITLAPDAIEIDIRRRADGTLVLWHDADPAGLYPGALTLEHTLTMLRAHSGLINCDLKEPGLEDLVCSQHAQMRSGALVLSGSIRPDFWKARPDLHKLAGLYLNAEEAVPNFYDTLKQSPAFAAAHGKTAAEVCLSCGAQAVNVHYEVCTPDFLNAVQQCGVGVSVWTVNDLACAKTLSAAGVLNITTRNAACFLAHFRAK